VNVGFDVMNMMIMYLFIIAIQKALDDVRPGTRQPEVVLDGILRRINDLQTRVTEALVYIATYDEQQYTKVNFQSLF
jgi:hypothetical protein